MIKSITENTVEVWRHTSSEWKSVTELHLEMVQIEPVVRISVDTVRSQIKALTEAGVLERAMFYEGIPKYRTHENMTGEAGNLCIRLNRQMDATGGDYPYGKRAGGVIG